MQNNNLTAFERELADVLLDSINVFTPRELEDTLFEVFEEAQNEKISTRYNAKIFPNIRPKPRRN